MCQKNNRVHGQKLRLNINFEPYFKKFAWQFKTETSAGSIK